eukprot:scaffold449003_cov55-Attheya_sp.AAC.1
MEFSPPPTAEPVPGRSTFGGAGLGGNLGESFVAGILMEGEAAVAEGGDRSLTPWSHAASQWGARVCCIVDPGRQQLNAVQGMSGFFKGSDVESGGCVYVVYHGGLGTFDKNTGYVFATPRELGKRVLERNLAGNSWLGKVYLGWMRHRKIRHSDVGGSCTRCGVCGA